MSKRIFVTGVLGQDGAYLSEYLLNEGYKVYGGVRRSSSLNDWRLRELGIEKDVEYVDFELLEYAQIQRLIDRIKPDVLFNLAAQSFVGVSFDQPLFTADVDAIGPLRILEAIRILNPEIRFYQASTSELFGKVVKTPQDEETPFYPRSPYGVAKAFAHYTTQNYREAYGIHASSGILFNHESPLRGEEFVTRKITSGLANIAVNKSGVLELGNMNAIRDWGHARDYVKGMVLMTEQSVADDYVLSTGVGTTVRDFASMAAEALELELEWVGSNENEVALVKSTGSVIIKVNPEFYRPTEVDALLGNAEKARLNLGWTANVTVQELASEMAITDVKRLKRL